MLTVCGMTMYPGLGLNVLIILYFRRSAGSQIRWAQCGSRIYMVNPPETSGFTLQSVAGVCPVIWTLTVP